MHDIVCLSYLHYHTMKIYVSCPIASHITLIFALSFSCILFFEHFVTKSLILLHSENSIWEYSFCFFFSTHRHHHPFPFCSSYNYSLHLYPGLPYTWLLYHLRSNVLITAPNISFIVCIFSTNCTLPHYRYL